jgi:hypothetical protein
MLHHTDQLLKNKINVVTYSLFRSCRQSVGSALHQAFAATTNLFHGIKSPGLLLAHQGHNSEGTCVQRFSKRERSGNMARLAVPYHLHLGETVQASSLVNYSSLPRPIAVATAVSPVRSAAVAPSHVPVQVDVAPVRKRNCLDVPPAVLVAVSKGRGIASQRKSRWMQPFPTWI